MSRRDFRQLLWPILGIIILVAPLAFGLLNIQNSVFRSNLELFAVMANTPVLLLLPALSAPMGNTVFSRDLASRNVVNIRMRMSTSTYLRQRLTSAMVFPFTAYAISIVFLLIVAFIIWPTLGNPGIDTSLAAKISDGADSQLFTYSQMTSSSTIGFACFYVLVVGMAAAAYGALGTFFLATVPNRLLALTLPTIVYFVQTFAAAFANQPQFGLLYSSDPFGLQQMSIISGLAPLIILVVVVLLFGRWTFRHQADLARLS